MKCMRLTKIRALELTIELFEWLIYRNKNKPQGSLQRLGGKKYSGPSRTQWPGWEIYGNMRESLPLCEYAYQVAEEGVQRCNYCLLLVGGSTKCSELSSPWHKWAVTRDTLFAQEYIDICKVAIAKLEKAGDLL